MVFLLNAFLVLFLTSANYSFHSISQNTSFPSSTRHTVPIQDLQHTSCPNSEFKANLTSIWSASAGCAPTAAMRLRRWRQIIIALLRPNLNLNLFYNRKRTNANYCVRNHQIMSVSGAQKMSLRVRPKLKRTSDAVTCAVYKIRAKISCYSLILSCSNDK